MNQFATKTNLKKAIIITSLFISMGVFGFGFTQNRASLSESSIQQIHLTCWDEEGLSSFERIRLVLNTSLTGLVWFSNFDGESTGEGTISPTLRGEQNFALQILSQTQNFVAEIPNFIFQPHVRSVKVTVKKDNILSSLECKKINLQKNQSASIN